jgi:hypothetical protein
MTQKDTKSEWKLYWVKSGDPIENCFAIARNARSAASLEERCNGFDPYDCSAELIKPLTEKELKLAAKLRKEEFEEPDDDDEEVPKVKKKVR